MNQSLSTRTIVASASVASMAMVWVLFVLPGTASVRGGLMGLFLVLAAMWAISQLNRWLALAPLEAEPLPVAPRRTSSPRK
jgi:hypothetical protein